MMLSEKVARIICEGCEENPDSVAGELGHTFRWEDYEPMAERVIDSIVKHLVFKDE